MNIGLFVSATLTLFLGITFVLWGRKRLLARISKFAVSRTKAISSTKMRRIGVQQFMHVTRMFVRLFSFALILLGVFLWLIFALELFDATKPWAVSIEKAVLDELVDVGTSVLAALPKLLVVAIIFFATRVLHEVLNHFFLSIEEGEMENAVFDNVTANATRKLLGFVLWISAIVIAYPYIPGSQSDVFKGISVLAGIMISLGSTNLVAQLVNGLVLIYTKTLRPGDYISVGQIEGTVEKIGLFTCSLRTPLGELVAAQNSNVIAQLKNYSKPSQESAVFFSTSVTIGYDTPWQNVRDALLAAANSVTGVRRDPAPFVKQTALEDYYARYELAFAPQDPARWRRTLSSVHEAIQDKFHLAGLQIMSPHYRADPEQPKIPPFPPPELDLKKPDKEKEKSPEHASPPEKA